MTTITKLDFSDVMYLPLEVNYNGKIEIGIGHQGHEISIELTVDQAKELKCMIEKTLEEIE